MARGILFATSLLTRRYDLVTTNVPYLGNTSQNQTLYDFCEENYPYAKRDLATVFLLRCIGLTSDNGTVSIVLPQNWLFLGSYTSLRNELLKTASWNLLARLGEHGFQSSAAAGAFTVLLLLSGEKNLAKSKSFAGTDVSSLPSANAKAKSLQSAACRIFEQEAQAANRQSVIVLDDQSGCEVLDECCTSLLGCSAGDTPRFVRNSWEVVVSSHEVWEFLQSSPSQPGLFEGREEIVLWEKEQGQMYDLAESVRHLNHKAQQWRSGKPNWESAEWL